MTEELIQTIGEPEGAEEEPRENGRTGDCPLCGGKRYRLHALYEDVDGLGPFAIAACRGCGLLATLPQLGPERLTPYYEDYGLIGEDRYGRWHRKHEYRYRTFVQRKDRGGLLEIGCNVGNFLRYMREQGWDVYGVEPSRRAADYARENHGLEVFNGPVEEFETDLRFDVVVLHHVLEHMPDPNAILEKVATLLAADGLAVIDVPHGRSLGCRLARGDPYAFKVPYHLYHYTPQTLTRLIRRHGLSPVELRPYNAKEDDGRLTSLLRRALLVRYRKARRRTVLAEVLRPVNTVIYRIARFWPVRKGAAWLFGRLGMGESFTLLCTPVR